MKTKAFSFLVFLAFLFFTDLNGGEITNRKIIYIYPGTWGELFEVGTYDHCLQPTYNLRELAASECYDVYQVQSFDSLGDFEYLFVFEIPPDRILNQLAQYPKEKLILFLWEPPSVIAEQPEKHHYFSKVYTWNDDLVDNITYFKLYYFNMKPMIEDPVDFDAKKMCTLMASNKSSGYRDELYSERPNVISFFENNHPGDLDLYGSGWSGSLKTYRGTIYRKVDVMKHYKFNFCYENTKNIKGYITEKIFDSFHAGCIPIYWGASNIADYVPKNCFIAAEDFQSYDELYAYLKSIDRKQFQEYMNNIREYLKTDTAQLFGVDHFLKTFMDMIRTPSMNLISNEMFSLYN